MYIYIYIRGPTGCWGMSFACGGRGGRSFAGIRVRKAAKRTSKLRWLRRPAGRLGKVASTGITPQSLFGVSTVGVSNTELAIVRRTAGASIKTITGGQSLTLALMLDENPRIDPIFQATIGPVQAWLLDVWDHRLPSALLGRALRDAIGGMSGAPVPPK